MHGSRFFGGSEAFALAMEKRMWFQCPLYPHMESTLQTPSKAASRRFILAWLGMVLAAGGIAFPTFTLFFLNWFDHSGYSWVNQLYQRKERMLASLSSANTPRLLIFGGSATIFGIDAELIEKQLGIHTVNFGSHAALEVDYQIARIKRHARKGDTVLYCPELELYGETDSLDEFPRNYGFTYDKRFLLTLSPGTMLRCLYLAPPSDYITSFNRWNDRFADQIASDPLTRSHTYGIVRMSPRGDLRGDYTSGNPHPQGFGESLKPYPKEVLKDLARWCKRRDIRLLLTWPNHMVPNFEQKDPYLIYGKVTHFCEKQRITIVGTPQESIFPPELFLDSIYHLNEIGRRIRTQKLIQNLRAPLKIAPVGGVKTVCLLSGRNLLANEPGIFEPDELVEYRYVTKNTPVGADCIAPQDLPALARTGVRLTCIDDATEAIAQSAGLRGKEIRRRESSLEQWVQRYNHHIFLLALVDTAQCDSKMQSPPKYFGEFLGQKGYRVALLGTGPQEKSHHITSNEHLAHWSKGLFEPSQTPTFFDFRIALTSGPASELGSDHPAIRVNGETLSGPAPGLAVAVLDPDLGIVVAQGTFQANHLTEWSLRELTLP